MFHPMVAGVTIPGMGLFLLHGRAVRRQEPVEQAEGPRVRDRDLHDLRDDVGGARHHRFVLPGPGLQLRVPLEGRHLLRAVGARRRGHRHRHRRSSWCSRSHSSSLLVTGRRRATTGRLSRETRRARRQRTVPAVHRARDRRRRRRRKPRRPRRRSAQRSSRAPFRRSREQPASPAVRAGRPRRARRHPAAVLQPGDPRRLAARPRRLRRRRARVPLAVGRRRLRQQDHRRLRGRRQGLVRQQDPVLQRRARRPTSSPTRRTTSRRRRRSTHTRRSSPAWSRATSRCTRSACTSAAACRGARRSQWFECPCHGSKYNRVGEKQGGPAPRGLDRFALEVSGGNIIVDTGSWSSGPADRHQHHRPGPGGRALCLSAATPRRRSERHSVSFRTIADHPQPGRGRRLARSSSCTASSACGGTRSRRSPRTSRRSSTTTCSRARTSSGCSACRSIFAGGRACSRCSRYFLWEPFREAGRCDGLQRPVDRARRDALRQQPVEGVRQHEVAAVRELPRRRRRGGTAPYVLKSEPTHAATRSRRSTPSSPSAALVPAGAGLVGGTQPHSCAACGTTREQLTKIITYGRPGHTDAGMGCAERQGRAQQQSIHDLVDYVESIQHHARQGAGEAQHEAFDSYQPRCGEERATAQQDGAGRPPRPNLAEAAGRRRNAASDRSRRGRGRPTQSEGRRVGHRVERSRSARRDRRRGPLPEQLRALPHHGLVVLRPEQPQANPPPSPIGQRRVRAQPHRRRRRRPVPAAGRRVRAVRLGHASACRPTSATASAASRRAACRTSAPC